MPKTSPDRRDSAALPGKRDRQAGYYAGPRTDHFDGTSFFNPDGEGPKGFLDVLRWQFSSRRERWPDRVPSPFPPDRPPQRVDGGLRVAFVGHASFLIQAGGLNILTDPVWSERASPFTWAGPRRYNPPGIAIDHLPPIDVVLVSHNHYDHLDLATLAALWRRDRPRFIMPLGNDAVVNGRFPDIVVETADWGDGIALGPEAVVSIEPAHHWSARGTRDRNRALWGAFVIAVGGRTLYFAGDTGFGGGRHFARTADRFAPIDLALLPIGAYAPRWFMKGQHMNPEDAVQAFTLLGAAQALGYHWGTFQLTDEGVEQPAIDLTDALASRQIAPDRFLPMRPGQVWSTGLRGDR
ncbi:MBL fold metallo-hydrolase [Azospirillum picis]|uniref:L-ascorbate metabolism protein UlaG (Beta-lactamase superfamily) n=1 Tax=Azospirillum picis TaxID=488438 RepID=A0ABU0MMR8_9PROT|nr:MBL fold metallo-hydrolase [Azospirillum picis]MBP2300792.1 L-ascorbate metabolism protein UlaG (beta-lactamase superfamily) [Azospirillum picis]MDQ0534761.1 L-ascorbate metabolism protein UlaG (beta-lactamase superfamily) [Azospirillum picis]